MGRPKQTHCPKGHELKTGNLVDGSRCRKCANARAAKYREKNKKQLRGYHLKNKYGITQKEWDELFLQQGKCCPICKTRTTDKWCVDHDHETGQVRGILCHKCNVGLGQFRDNIAILWNAYTYLADRIE